VINVPHLGSKVGYEPYVDVVQYNGRSIIGYVGAEQFSGRNYIVKALSHYFPVLRGEIENDSVLIYAQGATRNGSTTEIKIFDEGSFERFIRLQNAEGSCFKQTPMQFECRIGMSGSASKAQTLVLTAPAKQLPVNAVNDVLKSATAEKSLRAVARHETGASMDSSSFIKKHFGSWYKGASELNGLIQDSSGNEIDLASPGIGCIDSIYVACQHPDCKNFNGPGKPWRAALWRGGSNYNSVQSQLQAHYKKHGNATRGAEYSSNIGSLFTIAAAAVQNAPRLELKVPAGNIVANRRFALNELPVPSMVVVPSEFGDIKLPLRCTTLQSVVTGAPALSTPAIDACAQLLCSRKIKAAYVSTNKTDEVLASTDGESSIACKLVAAETLSVMMVRAGANYTAVIFVPVSADGPVILSISFDKLGSLDGAAQKLKSVLQTALGKDISHVTFKVPTIGARDIGVAVILFIEKVICAVAHCSDICSFRWSSFEPISPSGYDTALEEQRHEIFVVLNEHLKRHDSAATTPD